MTLNKEELLVTAQMARLRLTETEVERFRQAVEQMLEHFSRMKNVNVDGLEPTTNALLTQNRLRADVFKKNENDLMSLAPEREDEFISIPNIL
jgi:aspartyl-tRNA(Asn)/glutamyl-tRNA(Gln) amidotransferase subunit C